MTCFSLSLRTEELLKFISIATPRIVLLVPGSIGN